MTDPTPDLRAAADRAYGPADEVTHRAHERAAGMREPAVSEPELEEELLAAVAAAPVGPPSIDEVPWIVMPASGGPIILAGALLHPGLAVYPAPGPEGATRDRSDQSGEFLTAPATIADDVPHDPEADARRRPTLGGRVPGTGHWTVDVLDRPENPVGAEAVMSRPALRDPDGGCWASWMNLDALDGLRDQLAEGAAAMDAARSPRSIDGALAAHLNILALELAMSGNPGPVVAASTQVEGKKFDVTIAEVPPQPDPPAWWTDGASLVDDDSDDPVADELPPLRVNETGFLDLGPARPTYDIDLEAEPVAEVTVDVETDDGEVLGHVQVPVTIDRLRIGGQLVDVDLIRDAARSWLGGPDPEPGPVAEIRRGRHGRPHAVAHLFLAFGPGRLGRRFGEWLHFHTTEFIEETPDA